MKRLSILSYHLSTAPSTSLKGKTVLITGASRGIGLAIGLRCAKDGANVAILAKTTTPHPKLPGTFSLTQEPFTLLPKKSKRLEARLSPFNVISEMRKV